MRDPRADLEEKLRRDHDATLRLCQDLIRIPSQNPPGSTDAIVEFVAGYLDKAGIDFQVVAPQPHMPNLLATLDTGRKGKRLVLNGHLDTFPAGDPSAWSEDPFSGAVKSGRLFGRGAADMKTGCVASLLTYVHLASLQDYLRGSLTLSLVSDEETFGPWGTRYLLEQRPEVMLGDAVLSGEPNAPSTVRCGEKGFLWLELRVSTEGGHGAYGGRSAIVETAAILRDLEELTRVPVQTPPESLEVIEAARETYDRELGAGSTNALLRVTVNPGIIRGGTKINMIADSCRAEVDVRCPLGVSVDSMLARFAEVVDRHPEASFSEINRSEPNFVSPDDPLVRAVQANVERIAGFRPLPSVGLGATDCRLWRHRGIPAIVYGPTPRNMGAPDEHVTLDELFRTVWVHTLSAFDYLASDKSEQAD